DLPMSYVGNGYQPLPDTCKCFLAESAFFFSGILADSCGKYGLRFSRNTLAMWSWNFMIACLLASFGEAPLTEMITLIFKTLIAIGFGLIMVALL
ncbi:hypothetical protein N8667_07160, partial [Verrucomicrobia bacterium]|nr:hypothetical protein [Verrucomicrobiota bacterium]